MADQNSQRRPEIVTHTSLRGVAALGVVAYHSFLAAKYEGPLATFFDRSYLMVDLFFVLSGFILAYNYRHWFQNMVEPRTFWRFQKKRWIRIYPSYFVWLMGAFVLALMLRVYTTGTIAISADDVRSLFLHLILVQSIFSIEPLWNTPLWSIAVEFVAYLVFPVIAVVLGRPNRWRVAGMLLLGASLVGLVVAVSGHLDVITGGWSIVRCLGGFMMGCALISLLPYAQSVRERWLSVAQMGVAATALIGIGHDVDLVAAASFPLLVLLTAPNEGVLFHTLRLPLFAWLGRVSFSLYLVHVPALKIALLVVYKVVNFEGQPGYFPFLAVFFVTTLFSLVAAWVSFHLVEKRSGQIVSKMESWIERIRPPHPAR